MNEAVARMLERYDNHSLEDHLQALREILQEIALLGLWRSKFFDKAGFYGGTALRILYGLDRFSEDMDFSLLSPMDDFDLSAYTTALQKELAAFGFDVRIDQRKKSVESAVQSAFLKANTLNQLLIIETSEELLKTINHLDENENSLAKVLAPLIQKYDLDGIINLLEKVEHGKVH